MEKDSSHHPLEDIQAQMDCVGNLLMTISAGDGMRDCGLSRQQVLAMIQRLSSADFYKSMTTHRDSSEWQDVYRADCNGLALYLKFARQDNVYRVVSLKER